MKKYLGSYMSLFAGIFVPILCVGPLCFAIVMLSSKISIYTIVLSIACILCSGIWIYFLTLNMRKLYSWGSFGKLEVKVHTLLVKNFLLEYSKCKDVGIGYYIHGVLNSSLGSSVTYIYLSYDKIDKKYLIKMNMLKPSETVIMTQYSEKFYDFLIDTLPNRQSLMLKESKARMLK